MSTTDKVFRAIGIALAGSALSWLVTFGVIFCVEMAEHKMASIGGAGNGQWIVIPIMGSILSACLAVAQAVIE